MSQKKRILLIEDEEEIAALIKLQAEVSGYKLHVEVDGLNGFKTAQREKPDLIILDIYLPGQNGFDVVRKIKKSSELRNIPVIILSSKKEELDIVLGLELGADDYITKPFSIKIFFAKIKAILRKTKEIEKPSKNMKFGDFVLEIDKFLLRNGDKQIPITLSEFGILKRLIINRGKVLTRNQLLDDVNNDDVFIVDRNIDVHIASLRKKLGLELNLIETVRGVGYRFKESNF
ncbi:MAG: Alkaline phosphatase synthesis transcriptional regulatory protein PhoP [Candidatus Anoxychlamydiales bacterium]|nr:Alkaline phosphatase synthesis transcriptional regulatory protein PhoP [Candidatus Anoxychlamydiales bacterium]